MNKIFHSELTNYVLTGVSRKRIWNKAEEIVRDSFLQTPELFNTDTSFIPCELRYVSPFDKEFEELKIIQARTAEAARLICEYRGYLIIDLTQYTEHENDYYLDISLKFFRDKADTWGYVFLINRDRNHSRLLTEKVADLFCDLPFQCRCSDSDECNSAVQIMLDDCHQDCDNETYSLLEMILEKRLMNKTQMKVMIHETVRRYNVLSSKNLEKSFSKPGSAVKSILSPVQFEALITCVKEKNSEYEKTI